MNLRERAESLAEECQSARNRNDYGTADYLREELERSGYEVMQDDRSTTIRPRMAFWKYVARGKDER